MQKKLVIALLAATLVGFGAWYYVHTRGDQGGDLVLHGNVDIRQVSLAFTGSERIGEMRVEEGDTVKAGQVLATLDSRALKLQIDQANAQVAVQQANVLRLRNGSRPEDIDRASAQAAASKAQVDLAATQLRRLQTIRANSSGGRAVSQQDLDNAAAQLKVRQAQWEDSQKALRLARIGPRAEDIAQAEAQLQSARAQLALLQHNLDETELRAPQDATVRSRMLEPGDMASPQRAVYALAITTPKWVRAYINESQLGHIRPGLPARVTTDSHPDAPVQGQVGFISDVAEFTPKAVQTAELRTALVYEVRIIVDDKDNRLRLGMPATVRFAQADLVNDGKAR
ncbi:efflux RND transporter periplasmic adaptor subunit [Pseudomonas sp. KCJK8670]|uniref:efflux RND transporter periplasmic adaptor subunit n=1 Tax=Pseudomonas sp. KCJK8670 TaxID=3344558 RepID=UPI003905CE2B